MRAQLACCQELGPTAFIRSMTCFTEETMQLWIHNRASHNKNLVKVISQMESQLARNLAQVQGRLDQKAESDFFHTFICRWMKSPVKEKQFAFTRKVRLAKQIYANLSMTTLQRISDYFMH